MYVVANRWKFQIDSFMEASYKLFLCKQTEREENVFSIKLGLWESHSKLAQEVHWSALAYLLHTATNHNSKHSQLSSNFRLASNGTTGRIILIISK